MALALTFFSFPWLLMTAGYFVAAFLLRNRPASGNLWASRARERSDWGAALALLRVESMKRTSPSTSPADSHRRTMCWKNFS